MKNCILFGNGFNQLLGKDVYPSWIELICGSEKGATITSASYPLRYELAMAGKSKEERYDSKTKIQKKLKETVKIILNDKVSDKELYEKISEMDFCDYLTTNYDNFLYRYLVRHKRF